jgi:hypothetical protein
MTPECTPHKIERLSKQAVKEIIAEYVEENDLKDGDSVTFQIEDFRVLVYRKRTRE